MQDGQFHIEDPIKKKKAKLVKSFGEGVTTQSKPVSEVSDWGEEVVTEPLKKNGTLPTTGEVSANGTEDISSQPLPSESLSEEQKKTLIDQLNKPEDNRFSQGDLNSAYPQLQRAKQLSNIKNVGEENIIANAIKTPTSTNIQKVLDFTRKSRETQKSETNVFAKTFGARTIPDTDIKKEDAGIKERFYKGDLTAEDVATLKNGNPLLISNDSNLPNEDIAFQINDKTKKMADEARAINSDAFNYAVTKNDYNGKESLVKGIIKNTENESASFISVDKSTTSLPDKGAFRVGNDIVVNREDYLQEQKNRLGELQDRKRFLDTDFKNNIYDPHLYEVTKDIIATVENRSEMFNNYSQEIEKGHLIRVVNDILKDKKDPILMAYQNGADPNLNKILFHSFEEDVALGGKETENYLSFKDKNGINHTFKNDDYTDVIENVYNYFHYAKPAKQSADIKSNEYLSLPENKNYKGVIDNQKSISNAFSTENTKGIETILKTSIDAGAAIINDKYRKIIEKMPEYLKIIAPFQEEIKNGISPDDINERLSKDIKLNPAFKPLFERRDKEIKGLLEYSNFQRGQFIINGLAKIDQNIEVDKEGNLTVKGKTAIETKKFIDDYSKKYTEWVNDGVHKVAEDEKKSANELASTMKSKFGGFLTSLYGGINAGKNSMLESFGRYYDLPQMRDEFGWVASNELMKKSNLIEDASKFNGWKSLLNPNYYAYNVGQSIPYMLPAVAAGLVSGTGALSVLSGLAGGTLETYENALMTFNELALTGKNENGVKLTNNEAAAAAANNFAGEFLPNLVLSAMEFGGLQRGVKGGAGLKKSILGEVGGATVNLGMAAIPEAVQEGYQGYIQKTSKDLAEGKPTHDLYDYMGTDDFRQNFFGGLSGGIGFGAGGFTKRIVNSYTTYKNWEDILKVANEGYADFDKGVLRSYALNEELNGRGAQFRDGLRIRVANNDYKTEEEKAELLRTLSYSAKLNGYAEIFSVSTNNINGLSAAHNLAMSDMYGKFSELEGQTAIGKINADKSKQHLEEAKNILAGNEKGTYYITNKSGNPIFLTQRDAEALAENGSLDKMVKMGDVTGFSENLKDKVKENIPIPESKQPDEQQFQEKPITEIKTEKIFTDFDDTVFKDGKLTPLGEELKAKSEAGEDITVLTAREGTTENIKFIADQLGISEDKVKTGLSPQQKAAALTTGSVYYNENDVELEAARNVQGVNVVDTKQSTISKMSFRNDQEIKNLLNPVDESGKQIVDEEGNIVLTTSKLRLPREVADPVTGKDKMSIKDLKTRAATLRELVNCLT